MVIHLFTSESPYSTALLNLLDEEIDLKEHYFIFRKKAPKIIQYNKGLFSRIVYSQSFMDFFKTVLPLLWRSDWIFIHYLPYGPSLLVFYFIRFLIKKSTWIMWGGDVYIYEMKNKKIKDHLFEYLRKRIIPTIPEFACFIAEDAENAKKVYGSKAEIHQILYPIPISIENNAIYSSNIEKSKDEFLILLGNSADPSNCHEKALALISKFNEYPIKVYCPLSYYNDQRYIDRIISLGIEYFKDKFFPITNFMSSTEYAKFLSQIDIAIMNHDRQQALGNILPLIRAGKKVYIRNDISTFHFLTNQGCSVFDIYTITNTNFIDFTKMEYDQKLSNSHLIEKLISRTNTVQMWKHLFLIHTNKNETHKHE